LTRGRGLLRLNWEDWRAAAFDHRAYFFILMAITLGMYFGLPKRGDIDWPDASRHALTALSSSILSTNFLGETNRVYLRLLPPVACTDDPVLPPRYFMEYWQLFMRFWASPKHRHC